MLDLGSIQLPLESATKSFAILAKRGAGKSYTAGVMEEEMFKNNIPFIVFDPIDVHWGLRYSKDMGKGLSVVVFGVLENADIHLTDDMGKQIAQAVVSNNISCVISTFGMSKKGQRKLIADFSEELIKINNTPRHVFIEEAHEFVPQRVTGDIGRCFSAVEALVVMGRNRGLGVTLINQRAATINKDVLTQIDTLLAFRNVAPQDRLALRDWVEVHASQENFDAFWMSLPSLPTGEGWIWSPEWLEKFERIKIRERETLHPDREKLGLTLEFPKLEQADIQEFINSFKVERSVEEINKPIKGRGTLKNIKMAEEFVGLSAEEIIKKILNEHGIDPDADALKDRTIERQKQHIDDLEETVRLALHVLKGNPLPSKVKLTEESSDVVEMWIEKIGRNNSAGKILKLLHQKQGLKLTKHQIRTLVGISSKSSGFASAITLLKRNSLIKEDGGFIVINPDII
jgi:hypothetical protein